MGDPTIGKRWVILEDCGDACLGSFSLIWGIEGNIQPSRFNLAVTLRSWVLLGRTGVGQVRLKRKAP